jgi:hypothetical protein
MPKDPTENIARYKIRGGHLNEFEYTQHHGELERENIPSGESERLIPGTPPQIAAERTKKLIERVTQKMHPAQPAPAVGRAKRSSSKAGAQKGATKAGGAKRAGTKSASTSAKSAAKRSSSTVALSSTRSTSKKSVAKKGRTSSKASPAKKK